MPRIEEMEPLAPGANPYLHDVCNMGMPLGSNIEIMMGNHRFQRCDYFIIYNRETGERHRIIIED